MPACTECHKAKVKCDKGPDDVPCSRCVRLKRTCVPHQSKQGKGRKKRSIPIVTDDNFAMNKGIFCPVTSTERHPVSMLGVDVLEREASAASVFLIKGHFGLRWLLRTLIAMSIRRRSFMHLSRAAGLAVKCNISMDMIMCGEEKSLSDNSETKNMCDSVMSKMSFLESVLLTPEKSQMVHGDRLLWSEITKTLLDATQCSTESEASISNRWIIIREIKEGILRWFVTPAFERSIASWASIQATFMANKIGGIDVYMPDSEKPKFFRALVCQMSLHPAPNMPLIPTCVANVILEPIGTENTSKQIDVEMVTCLDVLNMDHGTLFVEFFKKDGNGENFAHKKQRQKLLITSSIFSDHTLPKCGAKKMTDCDALFASGELSALFDSI